MKGQTKEQELLACGNKKKYKYILEPFQKSKERITYSRFFGVTNEQKANLKIFGQKSDISEYKQIHRKITIL